MATLNGTQINNTYVGLLKTTDNLVLGATTPSVITDGVGNATPLSIAQQKVILEQDNQRLEVNDTQTSIKGDTVLIQDATAANFITADATTSNIGNATNYLTIDATDASFVGTVDFSTATVTGLPVDGVESVVAGTNITVDNTDPANPIISAAGGGAAGLVAGIGTSSMKSADTLTTNPSTATSINDIVLGDGAYDNTANATNGRNIIIGSGAGMTAGEFNIVIGRNALSQKGGQVTIGDSANNASGQGIVIGTGATANGSGEQLVIGLNAFGQANAGGICIGRDSNTNGLNSIALGRNSISNGTHTLAIGRASTASTEYGISIGDSASTPVNGGADGAIAIGLYATATANNAAAIGTYVTGAIADTVSIKALEVQTDSTPSAGGIIMSDAGGTDRRINIDASGQLQIDSTPVGGGGAAGLVAGAGSFSMRSDLTDLPASANAFASTAIGRNAKTDSGDSAIAIGNYSNAAGSKAIAIGSEVTASGSNSQVYGWNSSATVLGAIALGYSITADKVDTVSMKALDLQTPSTPSAGGIIMTDAGSVERRLNVNSGGELQLDNKLVGGKYADSDITVVQELGPSASDAVLLNILIPAGTFIAGDIINFKALFKSDYTGGDTNYFGMGLSTTEGTLGTAFASGFSSTNQSQFFDRTLIVNTADGSGLGTTMSSTDGAVDQNNGGQYQFPDGVNGLPFNWTVDQYLYIQAFASGIGSFVESRMLMVSKIN